MKELCNIDDLTLSNLQYYMPESKTLRHIADVFALFSDETRLKILSALALSPMCVSDLSKQLNINQTTISHQLRSLKNYNLVLDKRIGKSVVYSLGTEFVSSVMSQAVDYILA